MISREKTDRFSDQSLSLSKGRRASFADVSTPAANDDWPLLAGVDERKRATEYRETLMMIACPHVQAHDCQTIEEGGGRIFRSFGGFSNPPSARPLPLCSPTDVSIRTSICKHGETKSLHSRRELSALSVVSREEFVQRVERKVCPWLPLDLMETCVKNLSEN